MMSIPPPPARGSRNVVKAESETENNVFCVKIAEAVFFQNSVSN